MNSTTQQQLRQIIADETVPLSDRRESARILAALKTSALDLTIASDDPEYVRLRTPWPRTTQSEIELADMFHHYSGGMQHDEAVTRCRENRIIDDRAATWRDTSLHHLERLAAIAAYMEDTPKPNYWTMNGVSAERLLTTFDAKGNFSFETA